MSVSVTNSEWSDYVACLSSKDANILHVTNYLSDKSKFFETSTLYLEHVFPVYDITMLIYNNEFLTEKSINEKISWLQKIFELYFNYSKNLLVKFSIYRDKSIGSNTTQIVNYLSSFPNYSDYLSLIGYNFHSNTNEWKVTGNELSTDLEMILKCMTICCCLGYDYWANRIKYFTLSVFKNHVNSIETLIKENKCEYCDFDLDPQQLDCSVCHTEIEKMTFFNKWYQNFNKQNSLNMKYSNNETKSNFISLDVSKSRPCNHTSEISCDLCGLVSSYKSRSAGDILINNDWQCDCSFVNYASNINCVVCLKENKNLTNNKNDDKININLKNSEINLINFNEHTVKVPLYTSKEVINPLENEWACSFCMTINSKSSRNCILCFQENKTHEDISISVENKPKDKSNNDINEGLDNPKKEDISVNNDGFQSINNSNNSKRTNINYNKGYQRLESSESNNKNNSDKQEKDNTCIYMGDDQFKENVCLFDFIWKIIVFFYSLIFCR